MKIQFADAAVADVLAVQVYANKELTKDSHFAKYDQAFGGELSSICAAEHFTGKADQSLLVHSFGKIAAKRLLLIGGGDKAKNSADSDRAFAALAMRKAGGVRAQSLALVPGDSDRAAEDRATALIIAARLAAYRFDRYHTKDKKDRAEPVAQLTIQLPKGKALEAAAHFAKTLVHAVSAARDLINEPASVITPESFAKEAMALAKHGGVECRVLEPAELRKENMRLLLAVGQGSDNKPRVVHMSYVPKKKAKRRVVLIGKGVTFDSGGLSLKPAQSMEDMKIDMSGGAAVAATMAVIPLLDLDIEVHGLIGLVENMPSGGAYRPGDVIESRKGLTIEVNNTDAEGRLVLADVIDYANTELAPDLIIDLATLTGACMVALGPNTAGAFSNNDDAVTALLAAAKASGEDIWRLPLTNSLKDQLKSDVADMKNTGERWGGAITAALFLREFVGETPWIHLDIAGPASSTKDKGMWAKGGTGFGVATLVEFLTHYTGEAAAPTASSDAKASKKKSAK